VGDVTPIKRKKPARKSISVCWGGFGIREVSQHVVSSKGCNIDSESGLLILDEGNDTMTCYPMGGVFYWTEKDEPDGSQ
jgi:hypothetical protein